MSVLYILDVDDFRPLAEVAAKNPAVRVRRRGPYLELQSDVAYAIDRNDTGCRNAVWYSSVAALRDARITVWDKATMQVTPDHDGGAASTR